MNQNNRQRLPAGETFQWLLAGNLERTRSAQMGYFWEPLFVTLIYYLRQNCHYNYMCLCCR